jgi:hypothetical protein
MESYKNPIILNAQAQGYDFVLNKKAKSLREVPEDSVAPLLHRCCKRVKRGLWLADARRCRGY